MTPLTSFDMRRKTCSLLAAVFILAACSSGGDESAAPGGEGDKGSHPCRLVTEASAVEVLGGPVTASRATATDDLSTCYYRRTDGTGPGLSVGAFTDQRIFDSFPKTATGVQELPGIGDEALIGELSIAVMEGDRGLLIALAGVGAQGDPPGRRDQLIMLAREAVKKL